MLIPGHSLISPWIIYLRDLYLWCDRFCVEGLIQELLPISLFLAEEDSSDARKGIVACRNPGPVMRGSSTTIFCVKQPLPQSTLWRVSDSLCCLWVDSGSWWFYLLPSQHASPNCPQHKWLSLYHSWNVADYSPMKIRSCLIWRDEAIILRIFSGSSP